MAISIQAARILSAIPYLLQGVGETLQLTFWALVLGAVGGLLLALARVYGGSFLCKLAIFYSRIIRSLPLLVILFMLYYGGADFYNISAYTAIILALAIHTSAYQMEIFRGAIQSISQGQMEAALALGMNRFQAVTGVILPQAVRRALPYWGNEAAIVLKDTALAYVLGTAELMRRGQYVSARTSAPLFTYLAVGLIYFVLTLVLTRTLFYIERRVGIPD